MPSDFRILGPQVKNGEEGRGMEGRRERGELGRREGMEKGVARPNDISDTHRPAPYTGTNRGGKVNWEREGERERPCAEARDGEGTAGTDGAGPGGGDGDLKRGRRETGRTRAAWRH